VDLVARLEAICGPENVFSSPEDLLVFEYDAGFDRRPPTAVVVPGSAEEVALVARAAGEAGVAMVPRGAATGLSGGTIACGDTIVVSTSRLRRILVIDPVSAAALVEPGVVNLDLNNALRPYGLFFAPDPSSQRCSTIGGNIANNAGGPHALRYGAVVDHVLGVEMVLADGTIATFGGRACELPGYDLVPLIVGSEGTLGIVTKAWLRLLPLPEHVHTLVAVFPDIDSGARAASAVIAAGIVPAAMEMIDRNAMKAINQAFDDVHLPQDAGSMLLVEVEGLVEECTEQVRSIEAICGREGGSGIVTAATAEERERLWKARKLAYPALARIKPNNYLHDAVVPRTKLPEVLRAVTAIAERYGYITANVFHIGDGNLHPILLFDARIEPVERVMEASAEILKVAIEAGGVLSGEHGIGLEKNHFMSWIFSDADLDAMRRARDVFDPDGRMNPGKVLPGGSVCGDIPTERIKRSLAEGMWV
jgi:glycolate oxidase